MEMKISGFKPAGEVLKAYNQHKADQSKLNRADRPAGDSVQLSDEARFKKEIETALKNLPEMREDLVNRIKRDIQAGAYKPDADKIADGILKERLLDKMI
ncbi:flagellar biosynthesis anti-sigma factor FlgM [Desulforamulus putei]|uniref:Negative regulator of flagellin synthesis n=1 Tax=Desulforamulus putei DSM 12395 TaxID=1121429 RepID=A0A1M5AX80_9FIRM|nr:flagellar biosynthesis anti-sigma factor FlgM [Desulforamulus putei]SHF34891.1 anti-sigma-28 factor, FlgM family [Desulforamulus putei DSM 12395]